jgi:hypothetical protein
VGLAWCGKQAGTKQKQRIVLRNVVRHNGLWMERNRPRSEQQKRRGIAVEDGDGEGTRAKRRVSVFLER